MEWLQIYAYISLWLQMPSTYRLTKLSPITHNPPPPSPNNFLQFSKGLKKRFLKEILYSSCILIPSINTLNEKCEFSVSPSPSHFLEKYQEQKELYKS